MLFLGFLTLHLLLNALDSFQKIVRTLDAHLQQ